VKKYLDPFFFSTDWLPKDFKSLSRTGVAVGNAMVDLDYIATCHQLINQKSPSKVVAVFDFGEDDSIGRCFFS
jgi:hypothetical protein